MTIDIPHEYERVLNDAVASGAFCSQKDALIHALGLLATEHRDMSHQANLFEADEWNQQFRAWAEGHPQVWHFVDLSRKSIYEGRGAQSAS